MSAEMLAMLQYVLQACCDMALDVFLKYIKDVLSCVVLLTYWGINLKFAFLPSLDNWPFILGQQMTYMWRSKLNLPQKFEQRKEKLNPPGTIYLYPLSTWGHLNLIDR